MRINSLLLTVADLAGPIMTPALAEAQSSYELANQVFGLQRFFSHNVCACSIVVADVCLIDATNFGTTSLKTTFGDGGRGRSAQRGRCDRARQDKRRCSLIGRTIIRCMPLDLIFA